MLDDPNINVIFIPLPNYLHFDCTIWSICAGAGKHLLLEKPSFSDSKEANILFNLPKLLKPDTPVLLEASHSRFVSPSFRILESSILPTRRILDSYHSNPQFHFISNPQFHFEYSSQPFQIPFFISFKSSILFWNTHYNNFEFLSSYSSKPILPDLRILDSASSSIFWYAESFSPGLIKILWWQSRLRLREWAYRERRAWIDDRI